MCERNTIIYNGHISSCHESLQQIPCFPIKIERTLKGPGHQGNVTAICRGLICLRTFMIAASSFGVLQRMHQFPNAKLATNNHQALLIYPHQIAY